MEIRPVSSQNFGAMKVNPMKKSVRDLSKNVSKQVLDRYDKTLEVQSNLRGLQIDMYSAVLRGNHKDFVKAKTQYSDIAVDNFDALKSMKPIGKINVNLFSKEGFKMAKIAFLELFRKRTPNEKLLEKMAADNRAAQYIR